MTKSRNELNSFQLLQRESHSRLKFSGRKSLLDYVEEKKKKELEKTGMVLAAVNNRLILELYFHV